MCIGYWFFFIPILHVRYIFSFVVDNNKRKTHFNENYTFRSDTISVTTAVESLEGIENHNLQKFSQ